MQTHLIYGKMSSLWKYVAYEEELKPEVKALQEKLQNCKILMNQKVEWKEIKRIIGMGRSTYFRYKMSLDNPTYGSVNIIPTLCF